MAAKIKKSKRGGSRPGAGRPKNAPSKRDVVHRQVVGAVIERGGSTVDPVDAMQEVADWALAQWRALGALIGPDGRPDPEAAALRSEWGQLVVEWQSKAAPYIRPRLAAVEARVNVNITIYERIERSRSRLAIAA